MMISSNQKALVVAISRLARLVSIFLLITGAVVWWEDGKLYVGELMVNAAIVGLASLFIDKYEKDELTQ